MQVTPQEVKETLSMISEQNLDIRTITLGLSIRDCAHTDIQVCSQRIYDRLTSAAERLVPVADQIAREYGIPIVNKRLSVTPVAEVCATAVHTAEDFVPIALALNRAACEVGVDFVGGFSALVQKGISATDAKLIASIPRALASTERVCSSVNVGSTRAGINMDAVLLMAQTLLETARLTAAEDSIGCAKLVVFANAVEDNPFMAGAFHGSGEAEAVVNVGVSGPGVVRAVVAALPEDANLTQVAERIKATTFKITRAGELV
ncbi:MAG: DUF711 family protein, partial [Coriobacteriales bacterium]|nr:DUF711 family protein [Coriobacteriales bacterium]